MGSYASSVSNTNYTNTPVTLTDLDNPLTLVGSAGNQVGGSGNINGNLSTSQNTNLSGSAQIITNALDGGAIEKAFKFGSDVVTALGNFTKQANESTQASNVQALNFAGKASESAAAAIDKAGLKEVNSDLLANKTMWILGGFLLIGGYFMYKKG